MPPIAHKVFAYITHEDRLLVFTHPQAPEAGIQVPAGTVRPGEDPVAAVLREAWEETGLSDLILVRFLGEVDYDRAAHGQVGIHRRRFYHLRCPGCPPATWRHDELDPSDGSPAPIEFAFRWAPLPDGVPPLMAGHGAFLPALCAALDHPA